MTNIKLANIDFNAGTQLRMRGESQIHIEELAHVFIDKGKFAEVPVVGWIKDTKTYVPIDGFHRLMAIEWLSSDDFKNREDSPCVKHLDLLSVDVEVKPFATLTDAIIAAAGVNSTHGMKRQRGDIQNAIEAILEVDRERFMENEFKLSKKAIMAVVNCSVRSYEVETADIRSSLLSKRNRKIKEMHREGKTQREIAEAVGMTHVGVGKFIEKEMAKSGNKTQDAQSYQEESQAGNKTQDAQSYQEESPEEQPSVLAHMTAPEEMKNPWEDYAEEELGEVSPEGSASLTVSKDEPLESSLVVSDDALLEFLAKLSPAQQDLARNYLDNV